MKSRVYLFVTPFFPSPKNWRGAYCYDFVRALERTGRYRIFVFKPGDGADYDYEGVRVRTFRTRFLPSNVFPFLFRRWNQKSFLRKLEQSGIDLRSVSVCHGNTSSFSIYPDAVRSLNPSCRSILHHHDLGSFGLQCGILRHCWLYNLIEFPILRHWHEKMDMHVFISEMNRMSFLAAPDTRWTCFAEYKRQMQWLPWRSTRIKRSCVLYNGVDTSVFNALGRKAHDGFVIGCVGNYNPSKGQLVLLKAVKELVQRKRIEGLKVRLVGSGECLGVCKRFVAENGLESIVTFETEVRHEELPDFYRALDLFVLPSVWDGFGCVYTEAWACGTPFIATDGVGAKELVAEPDKWIIRADDEMALADLIVRYSQNRWCQRLICAADIDTLLSKFLSQQEGFI